MSGGVCVWGGTHIHRVVCKPPTQELVVSIGNRRRSLLMRCSGKSKSKAKCGPFYLPGRMLEQGRAAFGETQFWYVQVY